MADALSDQDAFDNADTSDPYAFQNDLDINNDSSKKNLSKNIQKKFSSFLRSFKINYKSPLRRTLTKKRKEGNKGKVSIKMI